MDGRTDRPTDRPSYRDARTHLKRIKKSNTVNEWRNVNSNDNFVSRHAIKTTD